MFELLILVLVGFIGYQIGLSVTAYRLRYLIHKEARRLGLDNSDDIGVYEEADPTVVQCVVEKSNNTLYLYSRDNSFICQGKSLDELAKLAKEYKNIKYAAVIHDEDTYGFVDGKVKTYAEIVK
jgi:hypothetical protein